VLWRHVRSASWGMILLLAGCSHDRRTILLIYSPHGKDQLQDYAQKFMGAHPEIVVQWEEMAPSQILDRIRAERDNPRGDIWFGASTDLFDHAAREGLLEPYTPTWADEIPAEARDPVDRWYGIYLTAEVIGYNDRAVKATDVPKDWDDLVDPRWKGKLIMRDPAASGGMRAVIGAMLERSSAATGSTAAGWSWLRKLDANTSDYAPDPTVLYQQLAGQRGLVTVDAVPDLVLLREREHLPVSYILPASGTPLLVDAIAIIGGARHPEAARAFYEFVGTTESLTNAAREYAWIPARVDIDDDSLPGWVRTARQQIKLMPVNRKLVADSLDAWMTYWERNVRTAHGGAGE
jgi:iron(III) transport system substrate-binding protein